MKQLLLLLFVFCVGACNSPKIPVEEPANGALFDGKSFGPWKSVAFGGEATPYVDSGYMVLPMATAGSLTGVRYEGPDTLPQTDYELCFEAKRIDGHDFFAGATFPVEGSHLTLIMGGWGGVVCGLSNIDDLDAARNETRFTFPFANQVWYSIRVRVGGQKVQVWFDEKQVVDFVTTDRKLNLRQEVVLTAPWGFCTFLTTGAIRNISLQPL